MTTRYTTWDQARDVTDFNLIRSPHSVENWPRQHVAGRNVSCRLDLVGLPLFSEESGEFFEPRQGERLKVEVDERLGEPGLYEAM